MAHLDRVPKALWQTGKEVFEYAHPFDVERRRELYEERTDPVAEFGHRAYEALRLGFGVYQVVVRG